ncbi:unnamed protein product [Closterium sp. Yama58-4]|nr:unnamed protein product [Closterium sp. Yama58-4]
MDTLYVLKVKCRGVLRRISSRRDPPAFDHVDGQIRKLFKIPADKPITVTYTDSDGDVITVSTDEDLHDAFIYQELNPLRLDVAVESDDFVDVCSLDGSVYSSSSFGGDAAPSAPSVPSAPSAPSAVAPAAVNSTPAPAASDSAADSAAQTVPVPPAPAVDEPPPAPASAPAPTPAPAPTQPDSAAPDASASTSEPAPAAADAAPAASEPAPAAASSSAQSSKPSVPEDLDEAFEAKVAEFATAVENQILKALASGGQLERMLAQYGPILKDAPGKIAQVLATARRSGLDVVFEPILEMHQRRQQQDQQYGGSSGGCGSSKPSTSSAADSAAAAAAADSAAAAADIAAAVSADVAAATSAVAAAIAAAADALGPNPEVAAPAPTPTPAPAAAAAAATAPAAAAAASASDSASESAEAVHYGITCDGCDMRPLKGKRYRSLVKHDFDLCEACYSKEGSISEHYECIVNPPAAKVYFPVKPAGAACSAGTASGTASACPATAASASAAGSQGSAAEKAGEAAKVVHYGIICDGCDKRPIQGKRYRSLVKDDYDLCEACYSKAGVVAEHYECIDRPLFRPSRLQHMAAHAAAMAGMQPEGGRPFFAPRPHCPFSHHSMPHSWGPGNKHHHHQHPHQHPPHHHHPNSTAFTSSSSVGGSVGGTVGQLQYGRVHGRLLDARYVRDVNVHDGTEMAPLTRFTKIWRLRNSGSVPWPCDLQVIHAGGDLLSETSTVPLELPRGGVYPEQEVDVAVDMAAPARPGRYMSHWRLLAPGGPKFGHRFWAQIQVVEPSAMEEEPAPLLAAAPAAAPAAASAPPAPLVPAAVAAESESPSLPEVVSVKASPSTDAAADAAPVEDAAAGAAAVDQAGAEEAVEESGAVSVVQVAEEKEEAGSVQAEEEEKLEVAVQSNEVVEEEQAEEVKEEVKAEEEKQEEEQEWEDPIITAIRNAADNIGSTAAGAAAAAESDVGAAMAAVGDVVIDVAPASAEPAAPASTAVIAAAASAEEWTDLRASSPADDTASTISTTTDATTSETIPSVLTASDVSSTLLPPLASSSSNAASDASSSVSTPRAEDTAVGSFSLVNVSYPSIASIACVAPVPAAPAPGQSLYPSVESIGVLVQEAAAAAEAAAGAAAGAVAAAGGAVTEDLLTGDDYVNVSQEVPTAPVLVPAAVPAPAAMPSPASFLDEEEEIEMETPPLIVNSSAPAAATPSTPAATSEAPGAPAEAPAAAPVSPAPSAVAAPGAVAYGGRYDSQVQQLLEMGFPYPALNGELLEFTSGNMDEVVTMLVKVTTEWQEKMDELEDMDFTDKEMNMRLLLKHDGSYKRTVRELVALDKASRKAGRADRA